MIQQRPRSDGSTAYYVTVDYPSVAGKRVRKSGTFKTQREAKSSERAWQTESARGEKPPSQQTLAVYLAEWLENRRHTIGDTTHANYEEIVRVMLVPRLGGVRLDRLTAPQVQRMLGDLRSDGRVDGKGGLSSSRVNNIRRLLAMALGDAARQGVITRDPMPLVKPIRDERIEYPEWTEAHLSRFLDAALATPLGPYWALALVTGMRRGELLGLRWGDIDRERQCLRLRQQVKALKGKAEEGNLKGKRPRVVQLGPAMLALLEEHRARQRVQMMAVRLDWVEKDLVFCGDDGRPFNPTTLTHMFRKMTDDLGLPHIKLHTLRGINASISVAEGADPRTLADRLGHSRPSTTADHYLLRSAGRQRDLAGAVEDVILRRAR